MKHRIPILIAAALGAAIAARADQNEAGAHHPMGMPLRGLERCLAGADISTEARGNAQAALAAGKDALKADGAAMKAAHEKMQTDIADGADKSVIGQDTLTQHADAQKLRNDAQAARDQVLAKLNPDQKTSLQGCLSARGAGGWHGSTSSE